MTDIAPGAAPLQAFGQLHKALRENEEVRQLLQFEKGQTIGELIGRMDGDNDNVVSPDELVEVAEAERSSRQAIEAAIADARRTLDETERATRERVQEADKAHSTLATEEQTLSRLLAREEDDQYPPAIDKVEVDALQAFCKEHCKEEAPPEAVGAAADADAGKSEL